ncbi:hypothetical protein L218DRAFT_991180 [Marasmius fiardii PR-910]|nr:hypothetical protein L218DRAFT_991180 [Marasmius fiardii PR-910]
MRILRRKDFLVRPLTGSGSHEEDGRPQLKPRRSLGGPLSLGGKIVGGIIKFGKVIADAGAGHDRPGGPAGPAGEGGGGGPAGEGGGGGPAGEGGGGGPAGGVGGGGGGKDTNPPPPASTPNTSTSPLPASNPQTTPSSSTSLPIETSTTTTDESAGSSTRETSTTQAGTLVSSTSNTASANSGNTIFTPNSSSGLSGGQPTATLTSPLPSRSASDVPSPSTTGSSLSPSAIGGISAGVVIAVLAVIFVALVCFRRRRRALNAASQNLSFEKAFPYPFTSPSAAVGVTHDIRRPILPPSPESIRRFDPRLMVDAGRSPSRSSSTLSSLGRIFMATRRNPLRVSTSALSTSETPSIRSATRKAGPGPSTKSRWSTTVEGELHSSSATNESGDSRSEESGTTAWKPLPNPFEKSRFSAVTTSVESSEPDPFGDSQFSGDSSAESSASGHPRETM